MAQTPFSAAEARMHEAMRSATGASAGEAWARKMIPHHQGALDMSQIVLRDTRDADIRRMAQKTVEMQTGDIAELQRWLETNVGAAAGAAAPGGGGEPPFAPAEAKMMEAMMAATGVDTDQTWARKMIAHHQGALDMARWCCAKARTPTSGAWRRRRSRCRPRTSRSCAPGWRLIPPAQDDPASARSPVADLRVEEEHRWKT